MPVRSATRLMLGIALSWCAFAMAPTTAAAQQMRNCTVGRVVGTAHLAGAQGERRVAAGLAVAADDAVLTQADGQVEIICSDGIVVTVGFATHIELASLIVQEPREKNVLLRLLDGIAGFVVPAKTFRSFGVETPTAVAAVRSTRWLVDTASGKSAVFVGEGRVSVTPSAGTDVILDPGEGIDVDAAGKPATVRQWGPQRIAAAVARLGFGWGER